MCSIELKNKIYDCFKDGLEPNDVIIKLNIPHEKRVVSGCYTYYLAKKSKGENKLEKVQGNTQKIKKENMDVVARYQDALKILIGIENDIKVSLDRESCLDKMQEKVLHRLESDDLSDENIIKLYRLLQDVRNRRRVVKETRRGLHIVRDNFKASGIDPIKLQKIYNKTKTAFEIRNGGVSEGYDNKVEKDMSIEQRKFIADYLNIYNSIV